VLQVTCVPLLTCPPEGALAGLQASFLVGMPYTIHPTCTVLSTLSSTGVATPQVTLCLFCSSAGRKCIESLPTYREQ
jgi:hypothetical protein